MSETLKRRLRCAVYTRKSTDEGLDQEYNSIDAQRDAGHAYIASQLRIPTIVSAHTEVRDRCSVRASVVFRVYPRRSRSRSFQGMA